MRLIENLLKAGYLEDWRYHTTPGGVPQGGILSPLLANIYLDRMDAFVESTLLPLYNRGDDRRPNRAYTKLMDLARYYRRRGDLRKMRELRREAQKLPSRTLNDRSYRRLKYIRSADNVLLGFVGPLREAQDVLQQLTAFLRDHLRLDLAEDKTRIVHGRTGAAKFLGYDVTITQDDRKQTKGKRSVNAVVSLRVPKDVITARCRPYMRGGSATHRPELVHQSVIDIVTQYQSTYRGIVSYYPMAHNLRSLGRLHGVMQRSLTKTLAAKLRVSVPQVYRRYRVLVRTDEGVTRSVLEVRVEGEGKPPVVARWGGVSLAWKIQTTHEDWVVPFRFINATELVQRLQAERCELCGSADRIQVHHVRALRDLRRKGRTEKPLWAKLMAARRRRRWFFAIGATWISTPAAHGGRSEDSALESRMT